MLHLDAIMQICISNGQDKDDFENQQILAEQAIDNPWAARISERAARP